MWEGIRKWEDVDEQSVRRTLWAGPATATPKLKHTARNASEDQPEGFDIESSLLAAKS